MTSLQQPCDLWANQALKSFVKNKYYYFRMSLNLSEQRKVKVPRETFVQWIEEAVMHLSNSQRQSRQIEKTFAKCGLDPHDSEKVLFKHHLQKMSKCELYNSLLDNQTTALLF